MSTELNLFGEEVSVSNETDTQLVARVLEKNPAAMTNRGLLLFLCAKERVPAIKKLSEAEQNQFRWFFRDFENIRRRAQQFRADEEQLQKGF